MNKNFYLLFTFLFLLVPALLKSQESAITQTVRKRIKISKSDTLSIVEWNKKLKGVDALIQSAENKLVAADSIEEITRKAQSTEFRTKRFEEVENLRLDAFRKRSEASKINSSIYRGISDIYLNHFNKIRSNIAGNDSMEIVVKTLENNAVQDLTKATQMRRKVDQQKTTLLKYKLISEADYLEQVAMQLLENKYNIILEWVVEDPNQLNPPNINDRIALHSFYRVTIKSDLLLKNTNINGIDSLRKLLTEEDLAILAKADKSYQQGDTLMKKVDAMDSESSELKTISSAAQDENTRKEAKEKSDKIDVEALQIKLRASNFFEEANKLKFETYQKNFEDVKSRFDASDSVKEQLETIESISDDYYNEAQSLRQTAASVTNKNENYQLLAEAYKLETRAIQLQEEAYINYLAKKQPVVTQIASTDSITSQNDPITPVETDTIIYKVQIAADRVQLNAEKLKRIYNGNEEVTEEYVNGWYKYSIGNFGTYEDAANFKQLAGVIDAFIVQYKQKKRY